MLLLGLAIHSILPSFPKEKKFPVHILTETLPIPLGCGSVLLSTSRWHSAWHSSSWLPRHAEPSTAHNSAWPRGRGSGLYWDNSISICTAILEGRRSGQEEMYTSLFSYSRLFQSQNLSNICQSILPVSKPPSELHLPVTHPVCP